MIDDAFQRPESITTLVYISNQYKRIQGPKALFIPSKVMLFKMMLSCIGKDNPSDLWFNSGSSTLTLSKNKSSNKRSNSKNKSSTQKSEIETYSSESEESVE